MNNFMLYNFAKNQMARRILRESFPKNANSMGGRSFATRTFTTRKIRTFATLNPRDFVINSTSDQMLHQV